MNVESFNLDHRTVLAPYVRVADRPILQATFEDILNATEVPAANEVQCGWGANHSLEGAQEAVREFLNHRDKWLVVTQDDAAAAK